MKKYLVRLEQRERNESSCVMDGFYSAEVMVQAKDIKEAVDTALTHVNCRMVQYDVIGVNERFQKRYGDDLF